MPSPRLWPESAPGAGSFVFERSLYRQGYRLVGGADEAGRGPLAGPVVAACVVLPPECDYAGFRDSKTLTAARRQVLVEEIVRQGGRLGVGVVTAAEIDRLNILQASLLAMKLAVEQLTPAPDFLLVDGRFTVPLPLPQQALIKGDARCASIAAASIVAKVRRDALMEEFHRQYPQYNFQRHKGYATAEHRRCLREYGPCPIHRQSFAPVREALAGRS